MPMNTDHFRAPGTDATRSGGIRCSGCELPRLEDEWAGLIWIPLSEGRLVGAYLCNTCMSRAARSKTDAQQIRERAAAKIPEAAIERGEDAVALMDRIGGIGTDLEQMRASTQEALGTVQLRYTIFGDRCDGTYLAVDATHAHMNTPATFVWARGLEM